MSGLLFLRLLFRSPERSLNMDDVRPHVLNMTRNVGSIIGREKRQRGFFLSAGRFEPFGKVGTLASQSIAATSSKWHSVAIDKS